MPKPQLAITFALIALFLASCHHKFIAYNNNLPFHAPLFPMIAATDDTINNYAIAVYRHHRFTYTISHGSQQPDAEREFYHGTWKYRSDTLFLRYHKKRPPGVANYLLKDITGYWLVQLFTDGRPRVFLRIPRMPFNY